MARKVTLQKISFVKSVSKRTRVYIYIFRNCQELCLAKVLCSGGKNYRENSIHEGLVVESRPYLKAMKFH